MPGTVLVASGAVNLRRARSGFFRRAGAIERELLV